MYHPKPFVASLTRSQPGFTVLAGSKLCAQRQKLRYMPGYNHANLSCGTCIGETQVQANATSFWQLNFQIAGE